MSKKRIITETIYCDLCKTKMNEKILKPSELANRPATVFLIYKNQQFDDLCEECDSQIKNFIEQLIKTRRPASE